MSSRSLAFLVLAGHLSVWVLGLMMLGLPLQAETFNVNSRADVLYPPAGTVTLRSAIQAANASPGGNIINLTMPGPYKITLDVCG
jgi:hypothetical protein